MPAGNVTCFLNVDTVDFLTSLMAKLRAPVGADDNVTT